jgi:sugar-specific transcriptional regulator TrmB
MEIQGVLEETGLAGNEAKVYLALLDSGSALAGEITKKSGVNRTNVYDALDKLAEKGLVSYVIQANRKYFEAAMPDNLIKYIEEREKELKKKKALIISILSELEKRRKLSKEPQEATLYKGKKGILSMMEDILRDKKELLVFGAEGKFMETMKHAAEQWHMKRAALKIPIRIVYNEKMREKRSQTTFSFFKLRFHPKEYDSPASTWIYGNKVAIIAWSQQPIVTLIRSKQTAESYRQFFTMLWNSSKE